MDTKKKIVYIDSLDNTNNEKNNTEIIKKIDNHKNIDEIQFEKEFEDDYLPKLDDHNEDESENGEEINDEEYDNNVEQEKNNEIYGGTVDEVNDSKNSISEDESFMDNDNNDDDDKASLSSVSTINTDDVLSVDPMYYRLTKFLQTGGGENVADILKNMSNQLNILNDNIIKMLDANAKTNK